MRNKVVFTNGCFDLLHAGHVSLLKFCREIASDEGLVIVGLNSDKSIERIKGSGRPIIPLEQRFFLLGSLDFVDRVFVFEEDTPINLINQLKPDVIVKGPDYFGFESQVVGSDVCKVVAAPKLEYNVSTSMIIGKIKGMLKR